MKKLFITLALLTSISSSSFAKAGDRRVLHKGVSTNIIQTQWSNVKHLFVGEAHYTLSDYNFNVAEVSAAITEAKRLGKVIDFVVIETIYGDDDLVLKLRDLTPEERSNQIRLLSEENMQLKTKIRSLERL